MKKLPAITPNKTELAEMVEVLEQDYDSAEAAAKAAVKKGAELAFRRDWHVIVESDGTAPLLTGFWPYKSGAEKAMKNVVIGGSPTAIYKVRSAVGREQDIADADEWEEPNAKCEQCDHYEHMHNWPKARHRGCVQRGCKCREYTT